MVVNLTELALFWVDGFWIIIIPGRLLLQDAQLVYRLVRYGRNPLHFFRSLLCEGKVGNMTALQFQLIQDTGQQQPE
jgi:hypothetical protein